MGRGGTWWLYCRSTYLGRYRRWVSKDYPGSTSLQRMIDRVRSGAVRPMYFVEGDEVRKSV